MMSRDVGTVFLGYGETIFLAETHKPTIYSIRLITMLTRQATDLFIN